MKLTKAQAEEAKAAVLAAVGDVQKSLAKVYSGAEVMDDDGVKVLNTLTFKFSEPTTDEIINIGTPGTPIVRAVSATLESDEDRIKKAVEGIEARLKATFTPNPPKPVVTKEFELEVVSKGRPTYFKGIRKVASAAGIVDLTAPERAYQFGMWALAACGRAEAVEYCKSKGIPVIGGMGSLVTKLAQENINSAGGFLVPEQFGTDIIDLKEQYGAARRLFLKVPMTTDTRTDPRRVSGLTAYFVAEGAAGTESTMVWDQVRLTAKDLMVLTRMTNQVNADSVISWGDRLAYELAYQFTLKEDQCGFLGDGSSTYGGIVGLAAAFTTKWSTGTAGAGTGLVKQATGTTWGAIVMADFNNVVASVPQYAALRPDMCWVTSRSFYGSVMQKLEIAGGGNTLRDIATGDTAPRPLFLGYPVEFAQVMPATTASAQVSAYLGSIPLAASFGDRQQDSIAMSSEATIGGQSMFERNEMGIRGTERFDINVHDIGDGTTVGPVVGLITG